MAGDNRGPATDNRVILLGASNVTRSFPILIASVRDYFDSPVEILAAHGHGRSYGIRASFMGRKLPGLRDCRLWDAVENAQQAKTFALVTDIGNDLLYEFDVSEVADWVGLCLDRLVALNAKTIVTAIPLENIPTLSETRYKFFRTIFVPGCRLSLKQISERTFALNELVRTMALARTMSFVSPKRAWYGADPIHVRRRLYGAVWREVICHWKGDPKKGDVSRAKWHDLIYLRSRRPHELTFLGRAIGTMQPSARFRDGTTIALY